MYVPRLHDLSQMGAAMLENIFFFGMSNSLINPLIYGLFHLWRPSAASTSANFSRTISSASSKILSRRHTTNR